MKFITYDPITGEITGRIQCDAKQAPHYLNRLEIDDSEWNAQPEIFQKVAVGAKNISPALIPLTESEARAKGASEMTIAEKIAAGKLQREKR